MSFEKFKFALEIIPGERWKTFEELASRYLTIEDPAFRTTACPSGDSGRDAELLFFTHQTKIMAQYSLEKNWKPKIIATLTKIKSNFRNVNILIYLTNHEIGANSDELKRIAINDYKIYLDIRDKNWFLERQFHNEGYENAAEIFSKEIADPVLKSKGLIKDQTRNPLSSKIIEDAFCYIGFEAEDRSSDNNLTKITFDGIVKSILKDTTSEKLMQKADIYRIATSMYPEHTQEGIKAKIDSSLERLDKKSVRHWRKEGAWCLTDEENKRQKEKLEKSELIKNELNSSIIEFFTESLLPSRPVLSDDQKKKIIEVVDKTIQSLAIDRGLQFVNVISFGKMNEIPPGEYIKHIAFHSDGLRIGSVSKAKLIDVFAKTMAKVLSVKTPEIQSYLRSINESYVLLFLSRQTIDSQKVISELFLSGEIWLDTNIILPAMAEESCGTGEELSTPFGGLLLNANYNSIKLHITSGVLEEIDRHFALSLACWQQKGTWRGEAPFLLKRYIEAGLPYSGYPGWVSNFRGTARPADDLAEYLSEKFHISIVEHQIDAQPLPEEQALFIKEAWNTSHLESKHKSKHLDDIAALRLARHDIENFIGILKLRQGAPAGMSHSKWWLTLDRSAFYIFDKLKREFSGYSFVSPIISIDFLINYLLIGPNRRFTQQNSLAIYPHFVEMAKNNYFDEEVYRISETIYTEMKGFEPRVIQRRVRDKIDEYKQGLTQRSGPVRVLGRIQEIIPEE